eukprot:TRINITY_DN63858_c0_g1_i1.p1 TRINITY_DN63858_c0_g1~~TRINITY_DN63858_c0_g1_i1.p1  ORF type:complete len:278 (-),score=70.01 TRINITY_DN63858_c0_g1_i1:107-856(-)
MAPGGASAPASGKSATSAGKGAAKGVTALCKFFGSAKGCVEASCTFSHDEPNSVRPCTFKQKLGSCERGEACTFRHQPWASREQAERHYAARGDKEVQLSQTRYRQLHRDDGTSAGKKPPKLEKEHVEMPLEREAEKDLHEETYGSKAMRMMEKMGYKAGSGLGKSEHGSASLAGPCLDLERASQSVALGFGNFDPGAKATIAERAARVADARAKKRQRTDKVVEHNLLSDDDSSEGEDLHRSSANVQL